MNRRPRGERSTDVMDVNVAAMRGGEEADVSGETMVRVRPWWADLLLRGPGDLPSLASRVAVTVVIAAGAVCLAGSGVIHLYLWGKQYGYKDVPTIGPLFIIQGIAAILVAVGVIVTRRVGVLLVGAGMLFASVVALVLAVYVGLFGFKDSWLAPYAWTSFYEELAGGVLLLAAAGVLAWPGLPGRSSGSGR
jgi:hypothetical protein